MIGCAATRSSGNALGRGRDGVGWWRHVSALIVAMALVSWHQAPAAAPRRVLFVGNSLTVANNLPAMVAAIARDQREPLEFEVVAFPNFSLEDHWQRGDAVRAIARGGWSTVVLQQGPSALPESRVLLRAFVKKFDGEARRAGAGTALYMVWPSAARIGDFDEVERSYAIAAADVGGLLLPAGAAWRGAWRRDKTLALYGADGFHPTPLGSYLAAVVIASRLTGRSPAGLSRALTSSSGAFTSIALTAPEAAHVQEAAAEAITAVVSRR